MGRQGPPPLPQFSAPDPWLIPTFVVTWRQQHPGPSHRWWYRPGRNSGCNPKSLHDTPAIVSSVLSSLTWDACPPSARPCGREPGTCGWAKAKQKAWPKSRRAQLQGAARLWLQEVGPRESVNTSRRCGPLGEKARLGLRVLWELGIGQPFSPSTGQTPRKAPDLTPWQFPSSLHTPLPSSSLDSFLPRLLNPQAEEVVCSHAGHFPSPPPCQLTGSLCPAFQANIRYHSTLIPHDHSKPRSLLLSFL